MGSADESCPEQKSVTSEKPNHLNAAMSLPRRHHYLPKFYLEGWGNGGKIWSFRKPHKALITKLVYPSETDYEEYLYSMRSHGESIQRETLELKFFQPIDASASEALRLLRQFRTKPRDPIIRDAWSRFVMTMLHRSPTRTKFLRERVRAKDASTLKVLEAEYDKHRRPNDPSSYAEYIAEADPTFVDYWEIRMIAALCDSPRVGTRINEMVWELCELERPVHGFLTGDTPIVGGMIGRPTGYILLPLSSYDFFLATNTRWMRDRILTAPSVQTFEGRVNDVIARSADELVIGASRSHAAFIDKRMKSRGCKSSSGVSIYHGLV